MDTNRFYLRGVISQPVTPSHRYPHRTFYKTMLDVTRLSGTVDSIPLIIPADVLERNPFSVGELVTVAGDVRTHTASEYPFLRVFGFVKEILENDENEPANYVEISGSLQKDPTFRVSPFGREISDVLVRVQRQHNHSTIPCIAWGGYARRTQLLESGNRVSITGRLQSREYQKTLPDGTCLNNTSVELSCARITSEDE